MKKIVAHTDGSSIGNPGPSGWACLIEGKLLSGAYQVATNNQMELVAMLEAVKACPRGVELHIISDSKVALGLVITGWKGDNEPLRMIRDEIVDTAFLKNIKLTGEYVKGHAWCRENSMVDCRAKMEAKQEKSRQYAYRPRK
jgi:ribonuclease HI